MVRLLVIDDDVELGALLREFLTREGHIVETTHDGRKGLERALSGDHDLAILDVMLPILDGWEVLRRLRMHSRLPVLMLTARGEEIDRIVGLELGADDYLPKPFNPRELAARIRAILRRSDKGQVEAATRLEVNGISLDGGSRQVSLLGKPVELSTMEFEILERLMRSAGRVLSRDSLMEELYSRKATPYDRSMDMHISHLRKKLESDGETRIKTIRGVGYQLCRTAEEGTSD